MKYIVIHRVSLANYDKDQNPDPISDELLNAKEVALRFKNKALGTLGYTPYHILIKQNGTIEQMLPLSVRGAHSKGYNWCSWAVAVVGNTDQNEIKDAQYHPLVLVCKYLSRPGLEIVGHTDLPGASADPNKKCPGRFLPLEPIIKKISPYRDIETIGFVI